MPDTCGGSPFEFLERSTMKSFFLLVNFGEEVQIGQYRGATYHVYLSELEMLQACRLSRVYEDLGTCPQKNTVRSRNAVFGRVLSPPGWGRSE